MSSLVDIFIHHGSCENLGVLTKDPSPPAFLPQVAIGYGALWLKDKDRSPRATWIIILLRSGESETNNLSETEKDGEETEGGVNTNFVLFNLREALEETDQTVKSLETDPAYGEPASSGAMMHLDHHVNTAWNARNSTVEQSQSCSDEAFQKWSRYPSDLKPLGVEYPWSPWSVNYIIPQMSKSDLQHQVDGMLRRGIFFSIFWLMGVGSLIAIIQAVKARKIIRQSNGEIRGSGKVMWCFIVGGAGLLFWGYVILMVVINVATA